MINDNDDHDQNDHCDKNITKRADIIDNKMDNDHLQCVRMIKRSNLNDL